ncbi:uncharacterized protein PV09_00896 [Verruconis gallopava]|uniref:non-specific serine/threonine protein kinase n=1 Tax=Verruconis gallopava TaxID=253628 RepID=A0A0D2AQS3_9PEZI|nr:uncharacterized protein PV09_00896 [Verruconis gallopava]KIW08998.1 hypothetical protein PV09_00896 [Verruconis gallopava]
MSSTAAVQPSAPTISQRPYSASPSSSSRPEQYYQQPAAAAAAAAGSSSTTRRAARPSNGASPQTPTQPSPAESSSSSMTPRAAALPSSSNNSPVVTMASASGPPIAPPPRTSSHNRSNTGTPEVGRSAANATPTASSVAKEYSSSNSSRYPPTSTAAAAASARSRGYPSPKEPVTSSPRMATYPAQSPSHSRSANSVGQPPMGSDLPREDSTIINRLIISDPQEDLARDMERVAESRPLHSDGNTTPRAVAHVSMPPGSLEDSTRSSRTRQEKSERRPKEMRFGDYILGQTLGEGEFGKVKMGWKRDGGVQVAIKLIRRDSLGSNPSRLPKIYREIAILRELQHPNIVRLHEMVETERHIGIILEYASGGELFDYILQHRFLKDNSARRLFAQLVSGVGYLHKKGIVHRDLKLENLLLDRNRNIIITDFGFANTFDSSDELTEEIELNLGNKDFVRRMGLDIVNEDGHRRGDLMQTSCGSPCYAAPELVVSDSLYTGRKVDVWSCGVILYAMLAGYLPFDDDPANPEGDNINLLYKYIVSTPLTFPEYVTPHARDLLKRILVPDPRKRADLFEVARHSWLSEYAHVVAFITSSTTSPSDISNTTVPPEDAFDQPHLARSASVREPTKAHNAVAQIGGLQKQAPMDNDKTKTARDAKRRTVQVEYVAPASATARGDPSKTRARDNTQGPVEVPLPDGYPTSVRPQERATAAAPSSMPPPSRPVRGQVRATSEHVSGAPLPPVPNNRPSTQGSMSGARLPSRGNSYGQPAVAVAKDTAQGRFSQPRGQQYPVGPALGSEAHEHDSNNSDAYSNDPKRSQSKGRGHKRSSTLGELFGKRGSIFGAKEKKEPFSPKEKPPRSHPPVSMKQPIPTDVEPRRSTESRRTSFSFSRKNTNDGGNRSSRRFSFIPSALSNSFSNNRTSAPMPPDTADSDNSRYNRMDGRPKMAFGRGESRSPSRSTTASTIPVLGDSSFDGNRRARDTPGHRLVSTSYPNDTDTDIAQHNRLPSSTYPPQDENFDPSDMHFPAEPNTGGAYYRQVSGQSTVPSMQQDEHGRFRPLYPVGFDPDDKGNIAGSPSSSRREKNVLQKPHRQFPDAGGAHGGKAKRVMDFFRMRGRARAEA